jgi:hypothetical protein
LIYPSNPLPPSPPLTSHTQYYYGFNHIRNWTVFNYDLDEGEVIQNNYILEIPTVEGNTGGGTTTLAAKGLACIDCYAYLAPEVQITLVWNEFYVTDFSASLKGSSVVNAGLGILDPAFLEIGKHFYEIYREDNFTDAVNFGLFTLDSKKKMTFEVSGFGRAAGAGHISARAEANGELVSRYKKVSGKEPPIWTHEALGDYLVNITEFDISHFDLKSFGVDFALVPSMEVRLTGTGFPFEGLVATTTAAIKAKAGFEISAEVPEANLEIEVPDDGGTAGEDMSIKIKWKDIPVKREDVINVFIHNDCWDKGVKHQVLSVPHDFRTKKGSVTLQWSVPFDASLSQLNFLDAANVGALTVCDKDKFVLSVSLDADEMTEYHSNEFYLLVNAVDGGYGVSAPANKGQVWANEKTEFAWKSDGFKYFQAGQVGETPQLVSVKNVSIFMFGEETDCTVSPAINGIIGWFDPQYGCEESWLQVAASLENDGSELVTVPSTTLEGKKLSEFDEVYASIVGVDNTNVFARNRGSFKVYEGCPNEDRYTVTFSIKGQSSLQNYYWADLQTAWYWKVQNMFSNRDEIKSTIKALGTAGGGQASVVWGQNPIIDKTLVVTACDSDQISINLWELDDITYLESNDDDYGKWTLTASQWANGGANDGSGIWSLESMDTSNRKQGSFPVTVSIEKVTEKGVPVTRRLEATIEAKAEPPRRNLREEVTFDSDRTAQRRLHHDDCVTAYYHLEAVLEMTNVEYSRPESMADFVDPVMNFIGFEEVETITLYNNPNHVAIDILPFYEATLHNFEGFDCASLREDPNVWESYVESLLKGSPAAVGGTAVVGVAVVAGISYMLYAAFGAGAAGLILGGYGAKKALDSAPLNRAGKSDSVFEGANPIARVSSDRMSGGSRNGSKSSHHPAPPPPPERNSSFDDDDIDESSGTEKVKSVKGLVTLGKNFLRKDSGRADEDELNRAMEMSHMNYSHAAPKSTVQRMEELHELKSKGYITDDEFEAKRKVILQGA